MGISLVLQHSVFSGSFTAFLQTLSGFSTFLLTQDITLPSPCFGDRQPIRWLEDVRRGFQLDTVSLVVAR